MCAKQLHNIQHRAHFVWQKNRELLYQWSVQLGTRLRQIDSHLNDTGERRGGSSNGRARWNYLIAGVSLANVISKHSAQGMAAAEPVTLRRLPERRSLSDRRFNVANHAPRFTFAVRIWKTKTS